MRNRERNKEKKVKSKGIMSDNFIWGEEEHNLLESFHASPARPSGESSIKLRKFMKKDGRVVTILA